MNNLSSTSKQKILLIDDSSNNIELLFDMLSNKYEIYFATNGTKGLELAQNKHPDLILLDIIMPEMDGFEVCKLLKINSLTDSIPVIFLTAETRVETIIKGFDVGIVDYVTKPFNTAELLARVHTQITLQVQQKELQQQNLELIKINHQLQDEIKRRLQVEVALEEADQKLSTITEQESKRWKVEAFVGKSPEFLNVLEQIRRLQNVDKTNVLILGESGTGKELVARAIHYGSSRVKAPFLTVNCSAIPNDLADSAFFGHKKGAFTGALNDSKGYFEAADGGTLFLDELGDMPLMMQTKLLRVLEEQKITRVGEHKEININVRVIAATNSHLEERIQDKSFRQDLYYRLTGYTIKLPSLRERHQDISLLVMHFLKQLSQEMNFVSSGLSNEALSVLQSYHFPGNVRELRNIIEHALISSNGQLIQAQDLHLIQTNHTSLIVKTSPIETIELPEKVFAPEMIMPENNAQASMDSGSLSKQSNESIVIEYLQQHQKINNVECQQLLNISHHQSSYLLKKMKKNNQLILEGERRWAFYRLVD